MNEKNRGNAIIEFCLIAPILIMILDGIFEFSLICYDQIVIENASRAGARWGIVMRTAYETPAAVQTYTLTYLKNNLATFSKTPTTPTVTVTQSSTSPSFINGDTLTVAVSYNYTSLLLHNFVSTLGPQITLNATTTMAYE